MKLEDIVGKTLGYFLNTFKFVPEYSKTIKHGQFVRLSTTCAVRRELDRKRFTPDKQMHE